MRILHIISSADPSGGGPIQVIRLNEEAERRAGGDIYHEVVSNDVPDAHFLASLNLPVHALGQNVGRGQLGAFLRRRGYSKNMIPWLKRNLPAYDAVIVDGLWNYASHAASRLLPNSNVPYFVMPHGMLDKWFKNRSLAKHCLKQLLWFFFEGPLVHNASSVLFATETERASSEGTFLGWKFKSAVVGIGVLPPQAKPETRQYSNLEYLEAKLGGRPYLVFLGRLDPIKGCRELLLGFAGAKAYGVPCDLVIVGPDRDGYAAELQDLCIRLGLDGSVHWTGGLYGEEKWSVLSGADALIAPSHYESFGVAVVEALSVGKPVLISNRISTSNDVIVSGAGFSDTPDAAGVCRLIKLWASINASQRELMGRSAKTLFFDRFNVDDTNFRLARLIHGHVDQ